MWRAKLTLEYHGADFHGWQHQTDLCTVQGCVEAALHAIFQQPTPVTVAGRTDAGVHARGQVAHVDVPATLTPHRLQQALNFHLKPKRVSVLAVEAVTDTFHARFSATRRHYEYHIINRRAPLTVDAGLAWHLPYELDAHAMHAGARYLLGHHDFSSFRAVQCQAASPLRTLDALDVARDGERVIITTHARSFLHHQVRNMVGTLALVGRGKWQPVQVKHALDAKDRRAAGATAPAHGLYLMRVDYDAQNPLQPIV